MMMKKIKISDTSGFSFVELMVVIALVGILAAIGVPNFLRGLPEKKLKGAARNLYADLQKARLLAVKHNTDVTVTFNTGEGTYSYPNGDNVANKDLADYPGVIYGCNATNNNSWRASADDPDDTVPASGVSADIIFTTTGTSDSEDIYVQSQNNQDVCYAVTTTIFGAVKIRRFSGSVWE